MLSLFKSPLEKSFHNRERLTSIDIHHDMVVFHTEQRTFTIDIRNTQPIKERYQEWLAWIAQCPNVYVHETAFFYNELLLSIEEKNKKVYVHNVIKEAEIWKELYKDVGLKFEWSHIFSIQGILDKKEIVSEEIYIETDSWLSILYSQYIIRMMEGLYKQEIVTTNEMNKSYSFPVSFLHEHTFLAENMDELYSFSIEHKRITEEVNQEIGLMVSAKCFNKGNNI